MFVVCLLFWYFHFHFDKVVGLQGSSGSRKSSFDSPGVAEEEAADGRQVPYKCISKQTKKHTNKQSRRRRLEVRDRFNYVINK